MTRRNRALAGGVLAALTVGCGGAPSPLDPRTAAAARMAELGWVLLVLGSGAAIVAIVLLVMGLVVARLRGTARPAGETGGENDVVITAGLVLPGVVVACTLALTIYTLREVAGSGGPSGAASGMHAAHAAGAAGGEPALDLEIVAQQWWWQVRYPGAQVVTANEVHIPAGVPVRLGVTSRDVVHSFWVPQVAGKVDVIPGKTNLLTVRVDQPGVYRGMCSEFCGLQHARMHVLFHVDPPAEFERWLAAQGQAPPAPTDPLAQRGQQVFAQAGCAECHAVAGSGAAGGSGPDLTHVASRGTLGAGTYANTPANLSAWAVDAQRMKRGSHMPSIPLAEADQQALLAYLEGLR